jgi:hypothetical protein
MGETVNSMLTRLVAYLAVAIAVGLLFLAGASVYQLMWPRPVKISAIGAPAVECRARATGNIVTGWKRRCARFPSRRAGDSRKMRGGKEDIQDLSLFNFRPDPPPYARAAARFGMGEAAAALEAR